MFRTVRPIQAHQPMPPIAALDVDRLIRRYRVQPRPHLPLAIEQMALQVDLHKRGLKRVLGQNLLPRKRRK